MGGRPDVSLNSRWHTWSGATRSKMAWLIYHQRSRPIRNMLYRQLGILSFLTVGSARRLCLVDPSPLPVSCHIVSRSSLPHLTPLAQLPLFLGGLLNKDQKTSQKKEKQEQRVMAVRVREKWLSVHVSPAKPGGFLAAVCRAVRVWNDTFLPTRRADYREEPCQQIVCLETSIIRCLFPKRRRQPNQNRVNNN